MARLGTLMVIVSLVAGCGGGSSNTLYDDYEYQEVRPDPTAGEIGPPSQLPLKTDELGTNLTRGRSKTVEWMRISTRTGTQYVGGGITIDRVIRNDAKDIYGVEVRLKNTTGNPISFEWRMYFLNEDGQLILGHKSLGIDPATADDWRKAALEGYGLHTITDSARMRGAVGFELRVRAKGSTGEGRPNAGVGTKDADALKRELDK